MSSNDYQTLKQYFSDFMYCEERNTKGHIIIID